MVKRPKSKSGTLGEGKVGYGRPPVHTRFKPGQSGNPKGRSKRSEEAVSLTRVVEKVFFSDVALSVGGKSIKMPAIEGMLVQLRNAGLKADGKSTVAALRIIESRGLGGPQRGSWAERKTEMDDIDRQLEEKIRRALGRDEEEKN